MKICTDCKHFAFRYKADGLGTYDKIESCIRNEVIEPDIVSGKPLYLGSERARKARRGSGPAQCGLEGKYFEKRQPSRLQRILDWLGWRAP